MKIFIKSN